MSRAMDLVGESKQGKSLTETLSLLQGISVKT